MFDERCKRTSDYEVLKRTKNGLMNVGPASELIIKNTLFDTIYIRMLN